MKYISLLFLTILAILGLSVELNPSAQSWQLLVGFHLAELAALTEVSLRNLKQLSTIKRYWFIGLQLLAFRIAYFPIVVFSATVSCYTELVLEKLGVDLPVQVFPELFVSAAFFFCCN